MLRGGEGLVVRGRGVERWELGREECIEVESGGK